MPSKPAIFARALATAALISLTLSACGAPGSSDAARVSDAADLADVASGGADAPRDDVPEAPSAPSGAPCDSDADCGAEGVCRDWPDGYCSNACSGFTECPGDGVCTNDQTGSFDCFQRCVDGSDCRPRYGCVFETEGRSVCAPTDPVEIAPGGPDGTFTCYRVPETGVVQIPLDYSPGDPVQTVVLYADVGGVYPQAIVHADGTYAAYRSADRLDVEFGYSVSRQIAQVTVPATPGGVTQRVSSVQVAVDLADEVCTRSFETVGDGRLLRLNVYSTIEGFSAAELFNLFETRRAFAQLGEIMDRPGFDIEVETRALEPRVAERYRLVRNDREAGALVAAAPGPPAVDALTLNVFIVESLTVGDNVVLGLSRGIPGPATMHETGTAGVIIDGGRLFDEVGNGWRLGTVMAHEIGHFLGLFHTTEVTGQHFDPLEDTPECHRGSPEWDEGECPDERNLMWPIDRGGRQLTADQVWVLEHHPLALDASQVERCRLGVDDDGDGLVDCDDPDCADEERCITERSEVCGNGQDDDSDGRMDCGDDDCDGHPVCAGLPEEDCTTDTDEDLDGRAGCWDDDCDTVPICLGPLPEQCVDGLDNDLDGSTDCADAECSVDPRCASCGDVLIFRGGACLAEMSEEDARAYGATVSFVTGLNLARPDSSMACCDLDGDDDVENALGDFRVTPAGELLDINAALELESARGRLTPVIGWNDDGTIAWFDGTTDRDRDGIPDVTDEDVARGRGIFSVFSDNFDPYGPIDAFHVTDYGGVRAFRTAPGRIRGGWWLLPDNQGLTRDAYPLPDLPLLLRVTSFAGELYPNTLGGYYTPTRNAFVGPDRRIGVVGVWELSGVVRWSDIVEFYETQFHSCDCAGYDPDAPVLEMSIRDGRTVIRCAQSADAACSASPDRLCTAIPAICDLYSDGVPASLADIDYDGDGVGDAMSVGFNVRAEGGRAGDPFVIER